MAPNHLLLLASAVVLTGCGAQAAGVSASNPIECGVALVIESHNARHYGSPELAQDLKPIIKWYIAKGAALPPEQRTQSGSLAILDEYQANSKLRKKVAKACITEAMTDPLYAELLPTLDKSIPDLSSGSRAR